MIFQFFGSVTNPLNTLNSQYGDFDKSGGGVAGLLSNVIKLIVVVGGVFALFNFITAGIEYIGSNGDAKAIESAKNKIFMSIIGLVIMAAAFLLTAIAGKLLFNDFTIFINPKVYGPNP